MEDRSTQVNLDAMLTVMVSPEALRQRRELIRRGTSMELHLRSNARPAPLLQNVLQSNKQMRPKSMTSSADNFHRSKISFLSETTSGRSLHPSETTLSLPSIGLDHVPAPNMHQKKVNESESSCRCFEEPVVYPQMPNTTPEGLSWRRLHLSRAKLKATSTTSELLSGFAMIAMVELQINEPTNVPEWLFITFAVCTTILVSVHIFALMISTYILPNIDAISKLDVCQLVSESPHERMRGFIEIAWAFSTVLGLFLFLVEVGILCWVKFWDYSTNAAIAATVIVIPVLVIFVMFAVHFYHSLLVFRYDSSLGDMRELEEIKRNLDEQTTNLKQQHYASV